MISIVTEINVPDAYPEVMWRLNLEGKAQNTRNGDVFSIPHPFLLEIKYPVERVLFDPIRDANPFFHVMEFIWMMAGSNDAEWISMFNKRMMEYSNDGILRGAYGWRWRNPTDQISDIIGLLKREPNTRQAVLSMWDPTLDGSAATTSDRPCNTHIYFRRTSLNTLDMTVCNRSNDAVWGMMGSNVVHFTLLQELIALAIECDVGWYRVFTNNLHVYLDMPKFDVLQHNYIRHDYYGRMDLKPEKLLRSGEKWQDFIADCKQLVDEPNLIRNDIRTYWMQNVAVPMYNAYLFKEDRMSWINEIRSDDWKIACREWAERRLNNARS